MSTNKIKRRDFVKTAAVGGLAVVGSKFSFASALAAEPAVELEEATVTSLQAAMSSGAATSRSITQGYLARIADIDKTQPATWAIRDLARKKIQHWLGRAKPFVIRPEEQ